MKRRREEGERTAQTDHYRQCKTCPTQMVNPAPNRKWCDECKKEKTMTNEEIKQEIETAKAQLDKLEEKLLRRKKLELNKACYYKFGHYGEVLSTEQFINYNTIKLGFGRETKELAEVASKNMITRNRLEAWIHERQGDGEGYWRIQISEGYYKAVSWDSMSKILGAVYMSQETAEWICESLNDGRISLED